MGYSVSFFDVPSHEAPPRVGGFTVIDAGKESAEVFCSNSSSAMWFRIKNPIVVTYYTQYFEELWSKAKRLKTGTQLNEEAYRQLESAYR